MNNKELEMVHKILSSLNNKCIFCHKSVDNLNVGGIYLKERTVSCIECEKQISEQGVKVVN